MKLSDLDPKDVTLVKKAGGLKLSDIHPDDVTSVSKASDSSNLKDLGIGLGQGATLGFGDELLGGAQTAGDVLQGDISPTDLQSLYKSYREHQKDNEAGVDAAKARSPYLTTGGEIAGGILPALLSGGSSEAISGPMAAKTLGKLALEQAGKGAVLGGIAGAGGSHGNVEDLGEMSKDSAFGAGGGAALGAIMPVAANALAPAGRALSEGASAVGDLLKKPGNALAQFIENSPTLRNLNDARLLKKTTGQSFTGTDNVKTVNDELNSILDDATSHVYGAKTKANEAYGKGLSNSEPTDTTSSDELNNLNDMVNGKSTEEGLPRSGGRGGMTVEGKALLNKAATEGGLNAQETKTLQNLINESKSKPGYADTNVPGDASDALNSIINKSLPAEDLSGLNSEYSGKLSSAEPFLNNGEVNKTLQKNRFSDTDPTDARNKISDFLNSVIKKSRDPNVSGGETSANFQRTLNNADKINSGLSEPVLDTGMLNSKLDNASLKSNILKSIYGERANGQVPGLTSKLMDNIAGQPMRAALGLGGAQRSISNASNSIASSSRAIFNASNESLSGLAQQLTGAGHIDIANSLNKALTSSDVGAKNAALFTIMQNPAYRQATQKFIDDHTKSDDSEGTN